MFECPFQSTLCQGKAQLYPLVHERNWRKHLRLHIIGDLLHIIKVPVFFFSLSKKWKVHLLFINEKIKKLQEEHETSPQKSQKAKLLKMRPHKVLTWDYIHKRQRRQDCFRKSIEHIGTNPHKSKYAVNTKQRSRISQKA